MSLSELPSPGRAKSLSCHACSPGPADKLGHWDLGGFSRPGPGFAFCSTDGVLPDLAIFVFPAHHHCDLAMGVSIHVASVLMLFMTVKPCQRAGCLRASEDPWLEEFQRPFTGNFHAWAGAARSWQMTRKPEV